jgi:hypothetical protein
MPDRALSGVGHRERPARQGVRAQLAPSLPLGGRNVALRAAHRIVG